MTFINYLSTVAVPVVILLIIVYGVIEKIKVFDTFIDGVKEGIEIVIGIFPTLMGLFLAITLLRESGVLELVINFLTPITNLFSIPKEIMPLAMLRPISGSASMAVATDIMSQYGTDTIIGLITSTLMGSTETTLYTIAIYTSIVKIKKTSGFPQHEINCWIWRVGNTSRFLTMMIFLCRTVWNVRSPCWMPIRTLVLYRVGCNILGPVIIYGKPQNLI